MPRLHARQEWWRIRLPEHDIEQTAWRLIDRRSPLNAILAECHGINGAAGFPLAEDDVKGIVTTLFQSARRRAAS